MSDYVCDICGGDGHKVTGEGYAPLLRCIAVNLATIANANNGSR